MEKRKGMKFVPFNGPDSDMIVVSLVEFKDNLYVATQKGIYILQDNAFERLKIVAAPE